VAAAVFQAAVARAFREVPTGPHRGADEQLYLQQPELAAMVVPALQDGRGDSTVTYIEENPVKAGLVSEARKHFGTR
jgi:hypothetical protein